MSHGLALSGVAAVRARWAARLGWPFDRRLRDDDCFGVARVSDGRFHPVEGANGRLAPIGLGAHGDEASAERELRSILERRFAERAADEEAGLGERAMGRRAVRIGPANPWLDGAHGSGGLVERYRLRGVEFGAHVGQRERRAVVGEAHDALFDLCGLLGAPPEGGSFWGRAGLAFGSRRLGGALGHFEPMHWVVHLDRAGGSGVLAHEMGHAFDAALAEASGCGRGVLLTDAVASGWRGHPIAGLVAEVSAACLKDAHGERTTFLRDAIGMETGTRGYWSTPCEMFARLFECWALDGLGAAGRRNDFLVAPGASGSPPSGLERRVISSPYPRSAERRRLVALMDGFLRAAVPMVGRRLGGGATGSAGR